MQKATYIFNAHVANTKRALMFFLHVKAIHINNVLQDGLRGLKCSQYQPINEQLSSHKETSQLICYVNQLNRFYMRGTLTIKGLKRNVQGKFLYTMNVTCLKDIYIYIKYIYI